MHTLYIKESPTVALHVIYMHMCVLTVTCVYTPFLLVGLLFNIPLMYWEKGNKKATLLIYTTIDAPSSFVIAAESVYIPGIDIC